MVIGIGLLRMNLSRLVGAGLLAATAACAQTVLDNPGKIADARKLLDTFRGQPVRCDVFPIKPQFNFTLKLQAGYSSHVPQTQSPAEGQKWIVLARVTPKNGSGNPVYLSDVVQLPSAPPGGGRDNEAEVNGFFWLGEGRYDVKLLLFDGSGNTCRKEWQIDAHLSADERTAAPVFAPGTVEGISWSGARATAPKPGVGRLTVLLDVVAESRTSDQILVIDGLAALMDQLPARSVRLVLFDLTEQKEIFRRDGFTAEALPEVAKAVEAVQFEPVDYRVLQNPGGGVDLIEHLVNLEIHSPEPSDAVVFLGARSAYDAKPSPSFGLPPGARQQFFDVLCLPKMRGVPAGFAAPAGGRRYGPPLGTPSRGGPLGRGIDRSSTGNPPNSGRDSVESAVDQLGGKILMADSPESFAAAVAEIARAMGNK